jgi:hypothetical protein
MKNKYWAIMRNGDVILTTVEAAEEGSFEKAIVQRNKWAMHYTNDQITVAPLQRRAQAEQRSIHGNTEARGWLLTTQ